MVNGLGATIYNVHLGFKLTRLYQTKIKALQACNIPWDIFNAKKIILKQDLLMQNLRKIGEEMPKIDEKPIYNVIQGP